MALTLADLRSQEEARRRAAQDAPSLSYLQQVLGVDAPPPEQPSRIKDIHRYRQDPSAPDTFKQRFEGEGPDRELGVVPGYQDRYGDPTKVRAAGPPPSLGAAGRPVAEAKPPKEFDLPPGFFLEPPGPPPVPDIKGPFAPATPAARELSSPTPDTFDQRFQGSQEPAPPLRERMNVPGAVAAPVTKPLGEIADVLIGGPIRAVGDYIDKKRGDVVFDLGRAQDSDKFEPDRWLSNYRDLSKFDKRTFGSDLRGHLDSIETVASRTPKAFQILKEAVPEGLLGGAFAEPAKAASIAKWMRAFERFERAEGGPKSRAILNIATRNLNNTIGTGDAGIDPEKVAPTPVDPILSAGGR